MKACAGSQHGLVSPTVWSNSNTHLPDHDRELESVADVMSCRPTVFPYAPFKVLHAIPTISLDALHQAGHCIPDMLNIQRLKYNS